MDKKSKMREKMKILKEKKKEKVIKDYKNIE